MVCLETSFIVDILRGNKEAINIFREIKADDELLGIASSSIMEVISNASLNMKKNEKEEILELILGLEILPLDKESAILAGEIEASLILAGEIIPPIDIMIGAIAKHNNETLITRNKKHFEKIPGLKLETY